MKKLFSIAGLMALVITSSVVQQQPASATTQDELVLELDLRKSGARNPEVELSFVGASLTDLTVDWGDGDTTAYTNTSVQTHSYTSKTVVTIRVSSSDQANRYTFGKADGTAMQGLNTTLTKVIEFPVWIDKYEASFRGAGNLVAVPSTLPTENVDGAAQSVVKSTQGMFQGALQFNDDLSAWDVSSVTNMSGMFSGASNFNGDIGSWDTSSVTTMRNMFNGATAFSQDINRWNTSEVKNMEGMFKDATAFNSPLAFDADQDYWNTESVTSMKEMFSSARSFNQDLSGWKIDSVTDLSYMFFFADSFNQDLGNWTTTSVTDMSEMFRYAYKFNQDLSDWDTQNVEDMSWMFSSASSFNQYIGDWDTSSVTYMQYMLLNPAFSYCLPAEFFMAGVVDYTTVGLASDFGDSCVEYVAEVESEPADSESAPAAPYMGPILSSSFISQKTEPQKQLTLSGLRLEQISAITIDGKQVKVISKGDDFIVIEVPILDAGVKDLVLSYGSGRVTVQKALEIISPIETQSTKKINAGSFKGFVAIYALGYEGQRLSAKIGNDWVIIDPIVNNETESLARITDFTGPGVDIDLKVYIDRQLVMTMPLRTK